MKTYTEILDILGQKTLQARIYGEKLASYGDADEIMNHPMTIPLIKKCEGNAILVFLSGLAIGIEMERQELDNVIN